MDESTFEERLESPSDEIMDDSISKVRSKYLTLNWISHDECRTRMKDISSLLYFVPELYTLTLIVKLELKCSMGISFVSSAIIICLEDVGEEKHDNPEKIRGSFAMTKRTDIPFLRLFTFVLV